MSELRMQRCSICGVEKPHTSEHFSGEGRTNGRLGVRCRPCKSERVSQSFRDHPETRQKIDARNKARRVEAGDAELASLTVSAVVKQGSKCYYCGTKVSVWDAQGDHKIPVSRGGKTTVRNVVASCARCNREKHSKTEQEYLVWRRQMGRG